MKCPSTFHCELHNSPSNILINSEILPSTIEPHYIPGRPALRRLGGVVFPHNAMQCNAVLSVVVVMVINIEAVLNRPSQYCLNAAEVRGDRGHEYSFPGTGLVSPPHRPSCVDYVLNECSNKYNPAEVTSGDLGTTTFAAESGLLCCAVGHGEARRKLSN
ncbi:hypothetical protein RP20_CCG009354 [Aedes albopictus]|nr:hypothetical protein RP20_CCG009354 [Aedes albopictus]